MSESAELDRIAKEVRAAAEACGAMILDTMVAEGNVPAAVLDTDKFPALIEHLKPRLVYMVVNKFDALEDFVSELEADEEDLDRDQKKAVDKWAKHNDQTSCLMLGVIHDGILHAVIDRPEWMEEFEEEIGIFKAARHEAINEMFARQQTEERERREAEEKKQLAPIIKKLVSDPRFNAAKISAAKRLALAETMFPQQDRTTLKKAVEKATNELWLRSC